MTDEDADSPYSGSSHVQAVRDWLEDNVQVYPVPAAVTLRAFDIDWDCLTGEFSILLDQVAVPERIRFALDITGRPTIFMPMFHSPLGAPASYCAIELSLETHAAIQAGLERTLPKMRAYGRNPITGQTIDSSTPFVHRIVDILEYEAISTMITSDYQVTVVVA